VPVPLSKCFLPFMLSSCNIYACLICLICTTCPARLIVILFSCNNIWWGEANYEEINTALILNLYSKCLCLEVLFCSAVTCFCKWSYSCKKLWRPMGLWDFEAPTFSRQSVHRWRWAYQPYAPAALYPQEDKAYKDNRPKYYVRIIERRVRVGSTAVRILEVSGSNLGPETGYPEWWFPPFV
jgi:hypothetical protein